MNTSQIKSSIRLVAVFSLLLLFAFDSSAQRVIIEQDVNADTAVPTVGKNRKNFWGSFVDVGMAVGESTGDSAPSTLIGKSWSFKYGMYYKRKISNWYSILGQLVYKRAAYNYNVDDLNPDQENLKSSKLVMNNVTGEFSNRFNFGKRGDNIGYYVEIGASADFNFMNKEKWVYTDQGGMDGSYFETTKLTYHDLSYIEALAYNAHLRFGFNKIVVFGDYRLTDRFKATDRMNYQVTPLMVGLRLDFGA